jgi:hypothetical protein
MHIAVKSPDDKRIHLEVNPSDTLSIVKTKIQEQYRLVFNGVTTEVATVYCIELNSMSGWIQEIGGNGGRRRSRATARRLCPTPTKTNRIRPPSPFLTTRLQLLWKQRVHPVQRACQSPILGRHTL